MASSQENPRLAFRRTSLAWVAGGLAIACCAAGGCRNDYRLTKVSGTVTLDGKPAQGIQVQFQPMASSGSISPGPGSLGVTDTQGHYTLVVQDAASRLGAVVGTHTVYLQDAPGKADPQRDAPPPPGRRYRTQTFEVPRGGTDQADFSLTPEPGKP